MWKYFTPCLVAAALAVMPALLDAQETRVTGQVTAAETGQPIPAARVTVKGTLLGTITDSEGRFSLTVPAGATTLVFAYIGYKATELPIQPEMQVTLERQAVLLEGTVVTALGIEREARSLSSSVQQVTAEQLTDVPAINLVNTLQGQVAGVQITDAGPTGGTARIVIRGSSSISGNNQPLFVVDGVPIDNSSPRNAGFGGLDFGNTAQDIDPNNIESITVLKGPNAAALYGSRAQNGAIVITTKSGRGAGALGVSFTTSFTTENPLRLPQYQNVYGQGFDGLFQWADGYGGGVNDYADESWGPKMDGRLIDQFTGPAQPFLPHPDNVRNFFRTGLTSNTNLAISRATETSNVRLSVTNSQIEGMMPGNSIGRLGLALKGAAAINDRLSTEASVNYVNQDAKNRPGTGYDEDNPMQSFIWFGRQVDMNALKSYRCTGTEPTPCIAGSQYNWNYNYHNNPYWEQLVNGNGDQRDRLLGHIQANYQLNDWITATARVGRDWYREHRKNWIEFNSLDDAGDGGFGETLNYVAETNVDLLVSARRQLTTDLTLDVTAGGNARENSFQQSGVNVGALITPGIYTVDNGTGTIAPFDFESRKQVRGLYGSISLNYRGYLNVDLTGRNDWSSTLPEDNNSFFYPSVGAAFVFSDVVRLPSFFSSGKVRASWTRVGNDTDPYQLAAVLQSQQPWGSAPMFSIPDRLPNADLKPEQTTAWEIGTDLGFFDERLGFVLTRYDRTTSDQILPVQISATSGYTSQFLNAGKVRNAGWELLLRAMPIRQPDGLSWDLTLNWGKNTSQVRELYQNLQTLVLGTYWSLNIEAKGPDRDANGDVTRYYGYGTMFGNGYLRDAQGRWLLDDDGMPQVDPVRRVLGNYNPDWNGGIQNRFSYGPFAMSVLVDGQVGGDIFSTTKWFGEYSGVLKETLRGRENDFYYDSTDINPAPDTVQHVGRVCDPGIVVAGVLPDGSVNGDGVNDVAVCPDDYFHANFGNHEAGIVDASYLKLREIRLSYQLPSRITSRIGFSGGEVALVGRNLALWSKYKQIDPETAFDASNVQGIEFGQFPTARSLGFSITLRR